MKETPSEEDITINRQTWQIHIGDPIILTAMYLWCINVLYVYMHMLNAPNTSCGSDTTHRNKHTTHRNKHTTHRNKHTPHLSSVRTTVCLLSSMFIAVSSMQYADTTHRNKHTTHRNKHTLSWCINILYL